MTTSEPTTGEIVRALRNCFERSNVNGICMKCEFTGTKGKYAIDADECGYGCETNLVKYAITRLESQERELSGITGELERFRAFHERYAEQTSKKYIDYICALTARAEQADRERDAAVAGLDALKDSGFCNSCVGCNAPHSESITYCTDWKRRGLPQDGEVL